VSVDGRIEKMMMNVSKALCISTLLLAGGFGFEALAEVPSVDEMLKP